MILLIAGVTVRLALRQRRVWLIALLALSPVAISLIGRLGSPVRYPGDAAELATGIFSTVVVSLVLPLTALLVGTSIIGQDLDEGTVVYLLTKPLARWKILVGKVLAGWSITAAFVALAVIGTGVIALSGEYGGSLILAFAVASLAGALAYIVVFVALGLRFNRALIIGLAYAFIWEGTISPLISGVRFLSIRAYTIGIARALTDVSTDGFEATLSAPLAIALLTVLVIGGGSYSVWRLMQYQIAERTQ